MISFDTNLLLYSLNQDCAEYSGARAFFASLPTASGAVAICELVLVELYVLLRNPAVLSGGDLQRNGRIVAFGRPAEHRKTHRLRRPAGPHVAASWRDRVRYSQRWPLHGLRLHEALESTAHLIG